MDETKVKSQDERIRELLEQPANEALADIKGPTMGDGLAPEEGTDVQDVEDDESNDKKVRIPRSRLKTLTSEVKALKQQLESRTATDERIAALEAQLAAAQPKEELPDWWKQDYGEGEEQLKAYRTFKRGLKEELRQELETERQQQLQADAERQERVQAIEQSFDDQMDDLEEELGRELTNAQKAELLDIVGDYSPMEDGQYTAYMSVSKAYDIWQKSHQTDAGKTEIARIAGASSQGGSTAPASPPGSPPDFNWRRKFGL